MPCPLGRVAISDLANIYMAMFIIAGSAVYGVALAIHLAVSLRSNGFWIVPAATTLPAGIYGGWLGGNHLVPGFQHSLDSPLTAGLFIVGPILVLASALYRLGFPVKNSWLLKLAISCASSFLFYYAAAAVAPMWWFAA